MEWVGRTRRTVSLPHHERHEPSGDEVIGFRCRRSLREFPLDAGVEVYSLGAADGNDLQIEDDPHVTPLHGTLVRHNGVLHFTSRGKGSSYVNRVRCDDAFVHDGAHLCVGHTTLIAYSEATRYELTPMERLRGNAPSFVHTRDTAQMLASAGSHALILGEQGTGKRTLAEMIHQESPRGAEPFVVVECDALDRTEAMTVFFGDAMRPGVVERARGGTLLIREFTELPEPALTPLLRLLRDLEDDDICVIATSSSAELACSAEWQWLRDRAVILEIPALRNRWQDIPALVELFLFEFRQYAPPTKYIGSKTLAALCGHEWPGNVGELREVLRESLVGSSGDELTIASFVPDQEATRRLITHALLMAYRQHGSIRMAAAALGIPKSTFVNLAEQCAIVTRP